MPDLVRERHHAPHLRSDRGERIVVPDWQTDSICVSALLPSRHPEVWNRLAGVFAEHGIPYQLLAGTRDVWATDFLPAQVSDRLFVKFQYSPDYLKGFERLRTGDEICRQLSNLGTIRNSDIVLDGGNVVASTSRAILTDKIFRENPRRPLAEICGQLVRLLRIEECIVVPQEPHDPLGHADGCVRFVDDQRVVINDYSVVDPGYGRVLEAILQDHGLECHELPYTPDDAIRDGIPSAVGAFVNFLRIGNLIVLPTFGIPEDDPALRILRSLLPEATIVPLPCNGLARHGGGFHCVAWAFRSAT